jgi:hypothetical protein
MPGGAGVVAVGRSRGPAESAELPVGVPTQAEMRAVLFASAQEAVRAVEDAGYSHDEQPVVHVDGYEQEW